MDVALVHWPAEAERLARLRARREPRLVVVVVSRDTLLRRGWPDVKPKDRNVLDVHVGRLRRLIAPAGLGIHTVHRRGSLLRVGD